VTTIIERGSWTGNSSFTTDLHAGHVPTEVLSLSIHFDDPVTGFLVASVVDALSDDYDVVVFSRSLSSNVDIHVSFDGANIILADGDNFRVAADIGVATAYCRVTLREI